MKNQAITNDDYTLKPGEVVLSPEEVEEKIKTTKQKRRDYEKNLWAEADAKLNECLKRRGIKYDSIAPDEKDEPNEQEIEQSASMTENEELCAGAL